MSGRTATSKIPTTIISRITKVFITNLPDKCSGKDLAEFVREYGVIYDIYIARKRDKFGNRFGFVSFLDVKDSKEIIRKIRNTCMGDCWLKANIARFTLEDGEIRPDPVHTKKQTNGDDLGRNVDNPQSSFVKGNRSFTDTLLGRQGILKIKKTVVVDDNATAMTDVHGRALVVRMIDLDALKNIYIILNDLCPGAGKIQYIGGLSVLITFENKETAIRVRDAAKEVLGRFSSVDLWEGQIFAFERLAWVKIVGVPLHLLSAQVINAVGNSVGKVLHMPSRNEDDGDLSYDYVGILAGDGKRIEEEITVAWKDKKFSIWVTEEPRVWVPEFYKVPTSFDSSPDVSDDEDDNVDTTMHAEENIDEQFENMPETDRPVVEKVVTDSPANGHTGLETPFNAFNAGIDGIIIANHEVNNRGMETPISLEQDTDRQDFIPGAEFDFEAHCNLDGDNCGTNINKRKKKGGLGLVGQSNPAYSSSLEKSKVGKKYRVQDDEDVFGLDPLLGLDKHTNLDLNIQPATVVLETNGSSDLGHLNGSHEINDPEVEATIVFGGMLGANLSNSHVLIQESIVTEGLQGVKK